MFLDANEMVPLTMYSAMDLTASALTKMETEEVEPSFYSLLFQQVTVVLTMVRETMIFVFVSVDSLVVLMVPKEV